MGSNRFFPSHVINVCSGDAEAAVFGLEAANTAATGFDRGKVVRRGSVAQVDGSRGRDRVSKPLCQAMMSFDEDQCNSLTKEKHALTAVLEGQTQSNISAPKAMETTRSSGYPTPMT